MTIQDHWPLSCLAGAFFVKFNLARLIKLIKKGEELKMGELIIKTPRKLPLSVFL